MLRRFIEITIGTSQKRTKIYSNENLYSWDPEFSMNWFLMFRRNETWKSFIKEQFIRFSLMLKSLAVIAILLNIYLSLLNQKFVPFIFSIFNGVSSIILIKLKKFRLIIYLLLQMEMLILIQFQWFSLESIFYIILFCEFTISVLLLFSWLYYCLLIIICFVYLYIFHIEYFRKNQFYISFLSVIIYGFIERLIKESWVLLESYKKSYNQLLSFIYQTSMSTLILNEKGKILFANNQASELFGKDSVGKNFTQFMENQEDIFNSINYSITKNRTETLNLKLINPPEKFLKTNLFQLEIKKFPWKRSSKSVIIKLKNISKKFTKTRVINEKLVKINHRFEKCESKFETLIASQHPNDYCYKKMLFKLKNVYSSFFSLVLDKYDIHPTNFNLTEYIFKFFDCAFSVASDRNITLKIFKDTIFPLEIDFDMKLLEFILLNFTKMLIFNSKDSTITFEAKTIEIQANFYLIQLNLICNKFLKEKIGIIQNLSSEESNSYCVNWDQEEYTTFNDFFIGTKVLREFLNGNIKIEEEQEGIKIEIILKINRTAHHIHTTNPSNTFNFSISVNSLKSFVWSPFGKNNNLYFTFSNKPATVIKRRIENCSSYFDNTKKDTISELMKKKKLDNEEQKKKDLDLFCSIN